jgi:hypothetical protein
MNAVLPASPKELVGSFFCRIRVGHQDQIDPRVKETARLVPG